MKVFIEYRRKKKLGGFTVASILVHNVKSTEEAIRKVEEDDRLRGFIEFRIRRTTEYPDKLGGRVE